MHGVSDIPLHRVSSSNTEVALGGPRAVTGPARQQVQRP